VGHGRPGVVGRMKVSQMDRRQALKLLAALGATGLAAACSDGASDDGTVPLSDEPVRIGLVVPQTGGYRQIGDEMADGFQLYLNLNDGRLGGHKVELLTADEGETAASGKAAVEQLLKKNVLALSGVANSSVMLAVREVVEKAKVPLIGSNASPTSLQGVVYIWRTSYVNDEPGRALGPYVAANVTGNIAMVAPDYPAGRDAIDGFREGFGKSDARIGSPTIWTEFVTAPNESFFAATVQRLKQADPAAIYCFFAGTSAVEFVKQVRAASLRQPIFAPGFLTEGSVLSQLGDSAQGITTALNYSADLSNPANQRFAAAYRRDHEGSPTTYAMASYDAAQVLDKAIRVAGQNLTPVSLNLSLAKVGQIDSPRGAWQFNTPRTPQQKWYLREVQRDGQLWSNVLIDELAMLG
jgi:branched-chain amino acid transport system substrate-binding protein